MSTTRRKVLIAISHLAAASTLVSCSRSSDQPAATQPAATPAAATADNPNLQLLAGVAYDILPYAELPPELYGKAAQQILDLKDDHVVAGLDKLRAASHNAKWKDVPEAERVAILTAVHDSPFFSVIRAKTLQVLLRDPATFAIVGYGGPSIQYGGYLGRGFNDINWLPASTHQ